MLIEYACKNCGYTLLLDAMVLKDSKLYCPSCNTKFIGVIVDISAPKKIGEKKQ